MENRGVRETVHVGGYVDRELAERVAQSVKTGALRERGVISVTGAVERGLRLVELEAHGMLAVPAPLPPVPPAPAEA